MSPSRSSLSPNRRRVLDFVRERVLAGLPPTVREVQRALGFRAVQSAQQHLAALVDAGHLVRSKSHARGYRLPEAHDRGATLFVPLVGRVQAGALTEAIEDHEGFIPVEARRAGSLSHSDPSGLFALRVRGDSMSGAGILDGDVVIVRRQATARSGDIVVARVGDEATVKRLRIHGGHPGHHAGRIELVPENPRFHTIVIEPPDELALLGQVIELRRHFDETRRARR